MSLFDTSYVMDYGNCVEFRHDEIIRSKPIAEIEANWKLAKQLVQNEGILYAVSMLMKLLE